VIFGISTDPLDLEQKFTEKENLNFPVLADADKKVAREYGVLNKTGTFAQRATFVIDKKGIVRKIYPMANAATNPQDVLTYIKEHLADKK
jgi:peroxiredoxin Q/BCP